jgi:hypothetical protein
VDHLPKVAGIPSPKDVLGHYIGEPKKLTYYADILGYYRVLAAKSPRVKVVTIGKTNEGREMVVVFVGADNVAQLVRLVKAASAIARDGAIWVVHPKGAASALRDLEIFAEAKRLGLTYTKVARFSATHTAEKLVIPKSKR